MSTRIALVSPSGNLYGSEKVLCDYLAKSELHFDIYVPKGTKLEVVLRGLGYNVFVYSRVTLLYIRLASKLLTKQHEVVYVNEGGHSKYIQLLARMFPRRKFVVHVRIMEDTARDRWLNFNGANITLVAISDYVKRALLFPGTLIYDLFNFPPEVPRPCEVDKMSIQVAVIGRVSYSKGFLELYQLAAHVAQEGNPRGIVLNIYGDVSNEVQSHPDMGRLRELAFVKFHGFVQPELIYKSNAIVLHLSKTEPLGRIYFEALSSGLPLVGFNAGGIGEIAAKIGLSDYLVTPGKDEISELLQRVYQVYDKSDVIHGDIDRALHRARVIYNAGEYTSRMDQLLLGNN
ncbi:MAG: glycosyltransferase family 4 protein [Chitinophagaceae bacterium]